MLVPRCVFSRYAATQTLLAVGSPCSSGVQQRCCCDVRQVISLLRRRHQNSKPRSPTVECPSLGMNEGNTNIVVETARLVACCESMCHKGEPVDLSANERIEATQLLISALARMGKGSVDSESYTPSSAFSDLCEGDEEKEKETGAPSRCLVPWEAALRLFLGLPPLQGEDDVVMRQRADLCGGLLQCLIRHEAPRSVVSAAYETLRTSSQPRGLTSADASLKQNARWLLQLHVSYARYLLRCASGTECRDTFVSLHKEALRVLLIDGAKCRLPLSPSACVLTLELLRRITTREVPAFVFPLQQREQHSCDEENVLWAHLDPEHHSGHVLAVAQACCLRIMGSRGTLRMVQEAFCRFVSVGMQLDLEELDPFLQSRCSTVPLTVPESRHVEFNSQLYIQFLDEVGNMLQLEFEHRGVISRMLQDVSVPPEKQRLAGGVQSGEVPHVSVWLVRQVLKGLAKLQGGVQAATDAAEGCRRIVHWSSGGAGGRSGYDVSNCDTTASVDVLWSKWRDGTDAALRCLRRLLFRLPGGRRDRLELKHDKSLLSVRQEVFCLLFQGVLDGVFYTAIGQGVVANGKTQVIPPVIELLMQTYDEWDWRCPSVSTFLECLHCWGMYDMLKRVFTYMYCSAKENHRLQDRQGEVAWKGDDGKGHLVYNNQEDCCLPLRTCEMVAESARKNCDAATISLVVSYMNQQLPLWRRFSNGKTSVCGARPKDTFERRKVEEWTRLMREEIVPRPDDVRRGRGNNTKKGDLSVSTNAKNNTDSKLQR